MSSPVQQLLDLLQTEQLDRNLFRSQPAFSELPNVFGGQVLAQALYSATQTVDPDRIVHSMHAYFLRPGNINAQIIFDVDPIRDGGSFTTRSIVAKQDGKAIFNTTVSFKLPEEGLEHQTDMPLVPDPETLTGDYKRFEQMQESDPTYKRPPLADVFRAFDMRSNGQMPSQMEKGSKPRQGLWVKTVDAVGDNQVLHQTLLAYASDFRLMGTALIPHGKIFSDKNLQGASIDHALWIHRPVRADEWLYYDMEGPSATSGTGMNFGRFFDRSGKLIASTAQEGLMRIRKKQPT